MIIRVAVPGDADEAARFHLACWREAYTGLLPADKLAGELADLDGRLARWHRMIGGELPNWLAIDPGSGRIVGWSCGGPGRDDDLELTELYALYAARSHWGAGVGRALVDQAIGTAAAYVWVLEGNVRAIRFYEKCGFALDGTSKLDPRFGVSDLRMVRPARAP